MFELLLDGMDRLLNLRDTNAECSVALLPSKVSEVWKGLNIVTPINRIGAHTCPNHTVPYGTALWGGAVPGTSCQATIAPSLRDISQQALVSLISARLAVSLLGKEAGPPGAALRRESGRSELVGLQVFFGF